MKVSLDREGCIGCGLCISTCPSVFQFDADGKAKIIAEPGSAAERDDCRAAAEGCPVTVIAIA